MWNLLTLNSLTTVSRTVRHTPGLFLELEPRKALLQLKPGLFQDHELRNPELCGWSQACFKTLSSV